MDYDNKTSSLILQNRYLIALLSTKKLAFSAYLVRDILIVERSQILALPFYDAACLGIYHYQNEIVPLVSVEKILGTTENKVLRSTLTAVRLNKSAEHLAGVAIVVDRMERSLAAEELSQEHQFQLSDIPQQIWQPQR
ncbi:chemotaxis protein CheW [Pleurocapsales cyanobacterium LEGE 10410]|nr:chemotaxis protein CheW [Pleurocapsales cyanobacterium LEGE 10410]